MCNIHCQNRAKLRDSAKILMRSTTAVDSTLGKEAVSLNTVENLTATSSLSASESEPDLL